MLAAILSLPRDALVLLAERLTERIDDLDGNADSENDEPAECEACDDGCGPIALRGCEYGI